MKLTEALKILQQSPAQAEPFAVTLACGFTPLHLTTFLAAHLQLALPARKVRVEAGLYGNLVGTVERPLAADSQGMAIALEWFDLDPRLGYRQTGGWGASDLDDIAAHSGQMFERLAAAIERVRPSAKVALSLPTLPLPPVFLTASWQASAAEMRLEQSLLNFAASLARLEHVAIVNRQALAEISEPAARFDFKAEIAAGLPYTLAHAGHVGDALARLIHPATPKKGLITDLDDTLWKGIAGEIGPDQVSWDLASHSQIHGLYQQTLRALAEQGALLAVASKNDLKVAEKALARPDLLIAAERFFPLEIHWEPKSVSVGRILRAWNIGAESAVFVDDSPMELAEAQAAHPGLECLLFPKADPAAAPQFLRRLRDVFAKSKVAAEDLLRSASIRRNAEFQEAAQSGAATPDAFLAEMKARVTLDFSSAAGDARVLELVNKTNQFNLNGRRFTESDWAKDLESPGAFVVSAAYEDKFGPLGKIAVLRGTKRTGVLQVAVWVMSCRAFARRIEHQCLRALFDRFDAAAICFDFAPTPKNGPLAQFFADLLDETPAGPVRLSRETFDTRCPPLFHTVIVS